MHNPFARLFDRLLPPRARELGPEGQRQVRVLVALTVILMLTDLVFSVVFLVLGRPSIMAMTLLAAIAMISLILALRAGVSRAAVGNMLVAATGVVLLATLGFEDINPGNVFPWFVFLPISALLLLGPRRGLAWLGIVMVFIFGMHISRDVLWSSASLAERYDDSTLALAGCLGLIVVISGIVWVLEEQPHAGGAPAVGTAGHAGGCPPGPGPGPRHGPRAAQPYR